MSDAHSRNSSNSGLSPTTSLASSLVSMNTEDHNGLYDHRQHPESTFIAQNSPTAVVAGRSSRARPAKSHQDEPPAPARRGSRAHSINENIQNVRSSKKSSHHCQKWEMSEWDVP